MAELSLLCDSLLKVFNFYRRRGDYTELSLLCDSLLEVFNLSS